ncbi:MAG: YkvA family protein [Bacillota bacterium]|nr:DUF1232 domain-containing protein [Candidatus Fermentithermobacillaceae bacterium]
MRENPGLHEGTKEGKKSERRIYDRYRMRISKTLESSLPPTYQRASQLLFLLPDLAVLILRLLKDARVPAKAKVNLGIAFAYLSSPVDILPDVVPVLGQLDDLIIATTAVHSILKSTPEEVVRENWSGSVDVLEGIQNVLDMVSYLMGNRFVRMIIAGFARKPGFSLPSAKDLVSNLIGDRVGKFTFRRLERLET